MVKALEQLKDLRKAEKVPNELSLQKHLSRGTFGFKAN